MIEDPSQLNSSQKVRLNNYLESHCTSDCGHTRDCPHEEHFIDIVNRELEAQTELENAINK